MDEELWRLIDRAIRDVAERKLTDGDEREDLVSETWERVIEHLHELKDRTKACTWAASIALHVLANRARKHAREMRALDKAGRDPTSWIPTESIPSEDERIGQMDQIDQIAMAVDNLDGLKKTTVILKYWSFLPLKEIADLLGVPLDTVKYLHRRAEGELRALLEKASSGPGSQQDQYPDYIRRRILPLRDLVDAAVDRLEMLILVQQEFSSVPEEWIVRAKILKAQIRFAVSCLHAGISLGGGGGGGKNF
jgi:RNA polymerase sigma-70 factor (ECF subfamily)